MSSLRLPAGRPALRAASCSSGPHQQAARSARDLLVLHAGHPDAPLQKAQLHDMLVYLQLLGVQFGADGRQSVTRRRDHWQQGGLAKGAQHCVSAHDVKPETNKVVGSAALQCWALVQGAPGRRGWRRRTAGG